MSVSLSEMGVAAVYASLSEVVVVSVSLSLSEVGVASVDDRCQSQCLSFSVKYA